MSSILPLEELCHQVEFGPEKPADLHWMPKNGCAAAHEMYAACVNFCAKADLPVSSIRISIGAWGAAPRRKRHRFPIVLEPTTVVSFDGKEWQAKIVDRFFDKTQQAWGIGELCLDERPAKMLYPRKTRGVDAWTVRVAFWQDRNMNEGSPALLEVWNPWATLPKPEGQRVKLFAPDRRRVSCAVTVEEGNGTVLLYGNEAQKRPYGSLGLGERYECGYGTKFSMHALYASFRGEGEAVLSLREEVISLEGEMVELPPRICCLPSAFGA